MFTYNEEMFKQTLLAATLNIILFPELITYDGSLLEAGSDYIQGRQYR